MKKMKKRICGAALTGTVILILVLSAKRWVVNAGNDGRELVDYTSPHKDYYSTSYYDAGHLFQAAGHFHLFASEKITIGAHCNGNFAAPVVNIGAACGTNQVVENEGDREMTYADKASFSGMEMESRDIALGKSHNKVTDMGGNTLPLGSISSNQIQINKVTLNLKEDQKIYAVPEDFIDFEKEFKYLRKVSKSLSEMDTSLKPGEKSNANQEGSYNLEDHNNAYIHLTDGVNVLNCQAKDISGAGRLQIIGMLCNKNSETKKHRITGTQSLIINVDCKGVSTATPGLETVFSCGCGKWPHSHGESNYYPGTIVIWNFYDSSKADKLYTGTVAPSKAVDGCYLAPNGGISAGQNTNGTLIAKTIHTSGESHRADFMGRKPHLEFTPGTDPTEKPSAEPTATPTEEPSEEPTVKPSEEPTATSTVKPTAAPSKKPTAAPSKKPTVAPSKKPTAAPSKKPTASPSIKPSKEPEASPTQKPVDTTAPTDTPGVPQITDTPDTPAPKDTPQAEDPHKTTAPGSSAKPAASSSAVPKKDHKKPSGKNHQKNKTTQRGNLYITITDSKTGAVVPNATVKITKPDKTTKTYTTDKNGRIKLKKTPVGKYKGVVTKVPKGYHADRTKFTSKVKPATTTKERVKIATDTKSSRKTNSGVASNSVTSEHSQPKTGDSFDIRIPIVLFLLAFAGMITAFVLKKRSYYYY